MNKRTTVLVFSLIAVLAAGYLLLKHLVPQLSLSNSSSVTLNSQGDSSANKQQQLDNSTPPNINRPNGLQIKVVDSENSGIHQADILINVAYELNCNVNQAFELTDTTKALVSDEDGNAFYNFNSNTNNNNACWLINISKQGYRDVTNVVPVNTHSIELTLTNAEESTDEKFNITGVVLDPLRQPVSQASITAHYLVHSERFPLGEGCESIFSNKEALTQSNNRGLFFLPILKADDDNLDIENDIDLCVKAQHPSWRQSDYQRITLDRNRLLKLFAENNSQAGSETAQFQLMLNNPISVSGVVVDSLGKALPNVPLGLQNVLAPDRNPSATKSDEQGRFVFPNIEKGAYQLVSLDNGFAISSPSDDIAVNNNTYNIEAVVFPVETIQGRVLTSGGDPLSGAAVEVRNPFATAASTTQTTTNQDGNFALPSHHLNPTLLQTLQTTEQYFNIANQEEIANILCLSVSHHEFASYSETLNLNKLTSDNYSLSPIYMQSASVEVTGSVLDANGAGTAATLTFSPLINATNQTPTESGIPNCDTILPSRKITTNNVGEFNIYLDELGSYQVTIETDKVWGKKTVVDIQNAVSEITLQID